MAQIYIRVKRCLLLGLVPCLVLTSTVMGQVSVPCSIQLGDTNAVKLSWAAEVGSAYLVKTANDLQDPWSGADPDLFIAASNSLQAAYPVEGAATFFQICTCCDPVRQGE